MENMCDMLGIEGNISDKLNVGCNTFPVEMLYDHIWVDRLDYEEAEASYQIFLDKMAQNAVSKEIAQTHTAEANKHSAVKQIMLPDEMMHDSVWISRLEYEEAEANCCVLLDNYLTMGVTSEREDVSNLSSLSSVEEDANNSLIHSNGKVDGIEDKIDYKMEIGANGCNEEMEPGSSTCMMDLNDFNGLKAAVIQLTQVVSTLSKENVKLKNRLENNEARMKNIVNNTTPTLKVMGKKMSKIETRVQKMEQTSTCMNSMKPYPYDAGQLNAVQLENLKQQLLIVCHRGNQNVMELIRKVETAQQIDKQQFDGAMQSLRTYLQHKETEHTEDLVKLKGEMEDFVNIKNRAVEELKKSIKKQKQVDDEARIRLQKRIEKIEMTFNSKTMNMPDVNKKGPHSDAGSYASSISSVCDEKPAAVCSANDSFNKVFSGVNMIDYVGQTNDYLQYFQQMNNAELSNGNAKVSNAKSTVSAANPVASWTKVSESMPLATSVPRVKYSEMLSQSSSSQQVLKSMFDGAKVATSSQLSDAQLNELSKEMKKLLSNLPDHCILLVHLRRKYQEEIKKAFPLHDHQVRSIFKKYCPSIRILGKEENALAVYIDSDRYPSHILLNQCVNILHDCESFTATGRVIAGMLHTRINVKVKAPQIIEEVGRFSSLLQIEKDLITLTTKGRCLMLRRFMASILNVHKKILLNDIGNKLSKKLGWTFSLRYYEEANMKELFESFGSKFIVVKGEANKQKVELGPLGKFYCDMKTLLHDNGGTIACQVLPGKYHEAFHKDLVFSLHGFTKIDDFVCMFPLSFKIYGEKRTRSLVLIEATTEWDWILKIEPSLKNCVALDCEMVGVRGRNGREMSRAARCSIVNHNLEVIYNKYIKPKEKIIDYRTKYSGISKKHLDARGVVPFQTAREEIMKLLNDKIVVGHSLHNDFDSLGLSWPLINRRDLSICPLVSNGCVGLKKLALQYLNREIQKGPHCCLEDATASMELYKLVHVQWEKGI